MSQAAAPADRIDLADPQALDRWTRELDVTEQQLRDAVQAVGDRAPDVELHLKGVRSSTNDDRVRDAGD